MRVEHRGHGDIGTTSVIRTMQLAMHALFLVLLVAGVARAARGDREALSIIGGCVICLWYAAGIPLAQAIGSATGSRRGRAGYLWIGGLLVLWVLLVLISPEFSWVAFALYFLVLHIVPRPASVVIVVAIALVTIAVQVTDRSSGAAGIIGPFVGMLVALGIAWVYAQLRAESTARLEAVQDLVAAQDDLLATQDALAVAQRRSGELDERARLARDIHDTLAQNFSSIVLLSRAGGAGDDDPARLKTLLTQIDETAASGLTDARRVVHALTPPELDSAPLTSAIRRLVERFSRQSGVPAELVVDGDARSLPTPVEVTLLRLTQGAIANVRGHADASRVAVTLTYGDREVHLDVADDGRGFDVNRPVRHTADGGFGLAAMRQRVAERGGTMEVDSDIGEGTVVHVQLPVGAGS